MSKCPVDGCTNDAGGGLMCRRCWSIVTIGMREKLRQLHDKDPDSKLFAAAYDSALQHVERSLRRRDAK
jgi:hypothetical protein